MKLTRHLFDIAAMLIVALLLIVAPAHAQTITNIAQADWSEGGVGRHVQSNLVEIDVVSSAFTLETFHPAPNGTNALSVRASVCRNEALVVIPQSVGTAVSVPSAQTNELRIGETLIIRFSAPSANHDPSISEKVIARLTTPSGDEEILEIFETGPDTGIFNGAVKTRAVPPGITVGDCQISVVTGERITVTIETPLRSDPLATTLVAVLADPFGFVFDSEDGTPVSGARVTLVDAATGQPATVFADDGITRWPSTVVSGAPVTDAAGTSYPMQPGEFRFPLASFGNYRLAIDPPAPYSAPSEVTPAQLASLTRPDGEPFVISDASYGNSFSLASPEPIQIDIPVDRPNIAVSLSKSVSRARAVPGDALLYTLSVRNPDTQHSKSQILITDTPSHWLRLRRNSIRVDGEAAGEAAAIAADGLSFTIALDPIPAGVTRQITYAMTVRADAPTGQALNRVVASDQRGGRAEAEASIRIDRDPISSRMAIIGRVTLGTCSIEKNRPGIPGVRVMLEDGSFAITDGEGRYHFEGIVPGTHVVQVQRQTLPEGGHFIDCDRSTRSSGSAISRFVIGQGGSLAVADFAAVVPGWSPAPPEQAGNALPSTEPGTGPGIGTEAPDAPASDGLEMLSDGGLQTDRAAAGGETDWLAMGDGPTDFLFPNIDHNPRAPALRVVIRHEADQKIELAANGKPVEALALDGTRVAPGGLYAVSIWRGIPLDREQTRFSAVVRNADGSVAAELERDVAFISAPWKAELLRDRSQLVADGKSRPVVAVRLSDRRGRPVRAGVSGSMGINSPYESAAMLDQMQLQQLSGQGNVSPSWVIEGDDGIAYIELAPTMVSGPLHLDFNFIDGDISRRQQLDSWVVPGDLEWTIVGLAEGSIGERSVADNMQRSGRFDSDLGDDARIALYAKGRVLGRFLLTLAYDSAKQEEDQRLLGTIDPDAYYTVFADGSDRRFDAASREKLYIRVETATFYALYGDFLTGFDQTTLARYNRTATGVKAEGLFGALHAQGFAAQIASRFRRDEIQGQGITGPYRLSDRNILANSERVAIEVRDRFRSEILVERRELMRFIDYDIDVLSGTITFKAPVLSRDFDLNPQFIVIDYEAEDGIGKETWNGGLRGDLTFMDGALRVGASFISDKGDGPRTDIGALDVRARIGDSTEIRAEIGVSKSDGSESGSWLIEAEHHTGSLDVLAYARMMDEHFGTGQQGAAEVGRRKFGVDTRYSVTDAFSVVASAWHDESLIDASTRTAAQIMTNYRHEGTEAQLGIAHFADQLANGGSGKSTVLEGGMSQRMLDNRLELSATTSLALDKTESIDLPSRHRLRARYSLTNWLGLVGSYEIANGKELDARTFNGGVELSPWSGGRILTTLGQQQISELGKRSFAAFGLSQSLPVTRSLTVDFTMDGSRTLAGADPAAVINPAHPVASGGQLGQDGSLFEDFTALTLGASWRKDRWSATARGEYRDGELANRTGFTAGVIRQIDDGIVVGSGLTWTRAEGQGGTTTEVLDGAISAAYRPAESAFAALAKLEYRSDMVTNAIAGETGPAGRTALTVTGDAKSRRILASLSTNWSPHEVVDGQMVRRTEVGLFLGARHNLDRFEDFDLAGTTVLGGLDMRIGIGERIELGGSATVRTNLTDKATSFAIGPQIGFTPADNTLVTVGYNISGFRDRDFSAARNTNRGFYASVRLKFDADSFSFLGLGRR